MQPLTTELECILGNVITLADLGGAAASATETLPLVEMKKTKPYMKQLPLAVVLPGALCIAFLFLGATCISASPKCICVGKLSNCLSGLLLTASLAFYTLFMAVGAAVDMDVFQSVISQITGTCDTTKAVLLQADADVSAQLANAETMVDSIAGMEMDDLRAAYDNAHEAIGVFSTTCDCMDKAFDEMGGLFSPAVICIIAIAMAFFSSSGLCCAVSCCGKAKPTRDAANKGKGLGRDIEMARP